MHKNETQLNIPHCLLSHHICVGITIVIYNAQLKYKLFGDTSLSTQHTTQVQHRFCVDISFVFGKFYRVEINFLLKKSQQNK